MITWAPAGVSLGHKYIQYIWDLDDLLQYVSLVWSVDDDEYPCSNWLQGAVGEQIQYKQQHLSMG